MSYMFCGRSVRVTVALTALLASLACDATPKTAEHRPLPSTNDPRTPVALPAEGRQAVLREMRQMLGALGGALSLSDRRLRVGAPRPARRAPRAVPSPAE